MEQMIAELGREDLYILIFLVVGLLAGVFILWVFVRTRNQQPSVETPSLYTLPSASNELAVNVRPALEPVPADQSSPELRDLGAPYDDIPADLSARRSRGLDLDPSVPVHSLEQIQRQEPKALSSALSNTRSSFFGRIKSIFSAKPMISGGEMEELEEILYTSDLGPQTVQRLLGAVESRVKSDGSSGFEAVRAALKAEMMSIFEGLEETSTSKSETNGAGAVDGRHLRLVTNATVHGSESYVEGLQDLNVWDHKPAVLMIVGVNGAGKTTTIGKLSARLAQSGRKVLVAAGDTFRAAAESQLKVWTERAQVEIFSPENVTDPSAVAFMACEHAVTHGFDIVIIDTAGRLHTQKNLMEELKKMKRVMTKPLPLAPHEILLVLDANSGQNALIQAREYHQALGVTGVVLTKLDGTAKGGVALGLAHELKIPIKLIGVGEGIDDLRLFSAQEFVDSIL